ncbi:helix-turn-helix domain-containing protein [Escherichia coli]|nr:helix-turn-helix domain-containing protein [Escherichia coli]
MADIATMRMKALHFWDKHGISAASEAFGVSCRTLYWWRQLLNKGGPEGLIPHSKHLWCDEKSTGIPMC